MRSMRSVLAVACALLTPIVMSACHPPGPPPEVASSEAPAAAAAPALRSAVEGVEWTLVELGGKPAPLGNGGKPATLTLDAGERRAGGVAGCNRVGGSYELGARALRFSALFGTKMGCATGMDLESLFTEALEATREYRLAERMLELVGEQGVLARFEAR